MRRTLTALICVFVIASFTLLCACGGKKGQDPLDGSGSETGNTAVGAPGMAEQEGGSEWGNDTEKTPSPSDTGANSPVDAPIETDPPDTATPIPDKVPPKDEYMAGDNLIIYEKLPEQIRRNYDYKVTVTQGDKVASIPVYNHTMEYEVSNRAIGGDLYRRFSQFAFSGQRVRVDIKVNRSFEYYSVLPSAKKFETVFRDGVISVYLEEPDYFGIRLDDDDNSIISVFADAPEYPGELPKKGDAGVIYVEGWTDIESGMLEITEPNTTLYIAPGAVLNSRVKVAAKNCKVIGRGVILDPFEDIYSYDIRNGGTEGAGMKLCMMQAEGGLFDGPILMDARCFNLTTGSKNVTVRNYKALSSMMTTDGITAGSVNSTYEHCWIYCGDNALVISHTENQTYKDIVIGTTCAAFFPQLKSKNITLDGIYVFRSNDGVIHNRYNSGAAPREVSITFKNIDCMDCINIPHFFQGGNMGELEKTITFDGVSLPHMSGVTDPHLSKLNGSKDILIEFTNPNKIFTANYTVNIHNVYIDGRAVMNEDQIVVNGAQYKNTLYFSNDGTYTPGERIVYKENYQPKGKVYIGTLQMSFKSSVVAEKDKFLLPAEELAAMLRTDKALETFDRGGIKYVSSDTLVAAGAAKAVKITDGDLYLTPVYSGENLMLPDEGKISQISEIGCYQVDLVVDKSDEEYVYMLYDYNNYYTGGFSVMFTEEIRKYGAGEYEFKFKAKSSGAGAVTCSWRYDNIMSYYKVSDTENLTGKWKDVSVKLKVTEDMLYNEMFTVAVTGSGAPMDYFAVKDLQFVKH